MVVSRQVHGTRINWHDDLTGLVIEEGADGHGTATPGVLLAVTAADCVPVYLADPVRRMVALVHAGWRGTASGIVGKAIQMLVARGCLVENIAMHCGIGVCGSCYEVGAEVLEACGVGRSTAGKGLLDLRLLLANQARGYSVDKISTSTHCSVHDGDRFFSHRGSGGADGRMVAYLGLPEGSPS
jgi:YfiH family protein